jgi:hypothetical protein
MDLQEHASDCHGVVGSGLFRQPHEGVEAAQSLRVQPAGKQENY